MGIKVLTLGADGLKVTLLVLLALFLISAALAQQPIRPETGSYIRDSERNGHGLLIIHNNWRMDTVAVLADSGLKPLCAVYIRSRDSFNLTEIEDGSYGLTSRSALSGIRRKAGSIAFWGTTATTLHWSSRQRKPTRR